MPCEFVSRTDRGLVRHNNEDSVTFDPRIGLAVLADGMGGHNAGEVASAMATSHIKTDLALWFNLAGMQGQPDQLRRAIQVSVENANHSIYDTAASHASQRGMGTTLVLALFRADFVIVGHVGDSRCYRLRGGELQQLTKDHSLLQRQLDLGRAGGAPPGGRLPPSNYVTRALGVEPTVQLELQQQDTQPGDIFLLCSDGLTEMLPDDLISDTLATDGATLQDKTDLLIMRALSHGGHDNVSVILAQIS